MIMGDVPFSNEVEIVRAELNFSDDVSKGGVICQPRFHVLQKLKGKK